MAIPILKLIGRKEADGTDPAVRTAVGKLSGTAGIVCNLLLSAGKLIIGTLSGAVSITADALNNLSDAVSAIVTLIGFRLSEKPADRNHPFGHARYEYLSGLAVAGLILMIGVELARSSAEKIFAPAPVQLTWPMVLVMGVSILVKLGLSVFNTKLGTFIQSGALLAVAADSRNDVIATAAVLAAALVEHFTGAHIDGFMGLGVALFILYSGVKLGKETISPLLGESASPQLRQLIVDTVEAEPRVLGYHDLMVHDYGPGQRFASLHVEMDQNEDPLLCHDLIDDIERLCLEKHNIHLVIHYDPVVIGDAQTDALRTLVQHTLHQWDEKMNLHDFRVVQGIRHTNLIFDVALPHSLSGHEEAIKQSVDGALRLTQTGKYYTVITFDPEGFNL